MGSTSKATRRDEARFRSQELFASLSSDIGLMRPQQRILTAGILGGQLGRTHGVEVLVAAGGVTVVATMIGLGEAAHGLHANGKIVAVHQADVVEVFAAPASEGDLCQRDWRHPSSAVALDTAT